MRLVIIIAAIAIAALAPARAYDGRRVGQELGDIFQKWEICGLEFVDRAALATNDTAANVVTAALAACQRFEDQLVRYGLSSMPKPLHDMFMKEMVPDMQGNLRAKLLAAAIAKRAAPPAPGPKPPAPAKKGQQI